MVVLADTSVWIEYLRATGSPAHLALRRAFTSERVVATCAPVRFELRLTPDDLVRRQLERVLDGLPQLGLDPDVDFDVAADVYRQVRRDGHTVRSSFDAVIAAIALRHRAELWHCDADFVRIAASVTDLRSRDLTRTRRGQRR